MNGYWLDRLNTELAAAEKKRLKDIAKAKKSERERCAKVCEAQYNGGDWIDGITVASKCAAAIRALADKPAGGEA